jgi:hypothetical protein
MEKSHMTVTRFARSLSASALLGAAALASFATLPAAYAADPPAAAPVAAAAMTDDAIAPYLDEGTFLVVRLDTDKVDKEALGKYMEEAINAMFQKLPIPANQRGAVQGQVMAQVEVAKTWLTSMAEAGGKRVYVLMDSTDLSNGNTDPIVVVPFGEGGDADKIKQLFPAVGGDTVAESLEHAVVFSRKAEVDRVKTHAADNAGKAKLNPQLVKAFASAGDVPLRVAYSPSEASRKWLEDNYPQLPEEIGGGETSLLSRGVKYAFAGVSQKPKTQAKITLKCEDAEKAKGVMGTIEKAMAKLKDQIPAGDGKEAAEKQLDAMKPKVAGDTITTSIDPLAVQMAMMGIRMEREVDADTDGKTVTKKADEKKKDDGGL